MNHEVAVGLEASISAMDAVGACEEGSVSAMNGIYFRAEQMLDRFATEWGGAWNAQFGFALPQSIHESSTKTLELCTGASPFQRYISSVIVPEIESHDSCVVGFAVASLNQLLPAFQCARELRRAGYDGFIALGGNTVSRLLASLAIPPVFEVVDGLVAFQGEEPLAALCGTVLRGAPLDGVPSLTWMDHGTVRTNGGSVGLLQSELPAPDYAGLPVGAYWGVNYLNLAASRGCYYGKCTFCAIPYGAGGFGGFKSPSVVFAEMLQLHEQYGIPRFKFVDEALSPRFMRGLAILIEASGSPFEWEAYVRLETAWRDSQFVAGLAAGGFRKGYFGLELLPGSHRKSLNKGDAPDPGLLCDICSAVGVRIHFFCMFGFEVKSRGV
jgi:hypothetical protein